ncbi:uncharacterized protein [Nicotiana tomentosiformis]|uniref:uncharacterized protein n=1 Tax=Nicotiana tomentosiformis TaxID=4098 RepID=UPI00388C859F
MGGAQPVVAAIPERIRAAAGDLQRLLDRWTRLHPLVFRDERHEDPQDFIDRCRDKLHNMRILESHELQQGQISVTDYEARFSELSRHVLMILPTDEERVHRFVAGLHSGSQATITREVEMKTSYELFVEIAHRIKGVRQWGREQATNDKRFRYFGELSGAPAGGRGQSSGPTYFCTIIIGMEGVPAPPTPQGVLVRPYFSAMPESSYRPPYIQGSSSGYSRYQGQAFGQQSTVPRGYYECGDPGHMKRFCPRLQGNVVQQGHQPTITAPAAAPVVQPPRGGEQVGRGRPRGGGQTCGG